MEYEIRVKYVPVTKRASYRFYGEAVRRLSKEEFAPAISVLLSAAVNEMVSFKGFSRRDAVKTILYQAGLDDITTVRKEVI